jgi:hypothetical protein
MMFYNGFNLLIDILLVLATGIYCYKSGWWRGYSEGHQDGRQHLERELIEEQVRNM